MTLPFEFRCGDFVWARLKGFPWWPASIAECNAKTASNKGKNLGKWKRKAKDGSYEIWVSFYNETQGSWLKPRSLEAYNPETVATKLVNANHKYYAKIMDALGALQEQWKLFESTGLIKDNKMVRHAEDEADTEEEREIAQPPPESPTTNRQRKPLKRVRPSSTGATPKPKRAKVVKAKSARQSTSGRRRKKASILKTVARVEEEEDLGADEDDSDGDNLQISAEEEEELYAITQRKDSGSRGKPTSSASSAKIKELKESLREKDEELRAKTEELKKKSDEVDRWKKKYNSIRRDLRDMKGGASSIIVPAVPAELDPGSPVSKDALFKKSIDEEMLYSMVREMEKKVRKFAQQGKEADRLRSELMESVRAFKALVDKVRDAERDAVDLEKQLGLSLRNMLEYNVSVEMLHATRAGRTVREVRKKLKHSRYITTYGDQLVNEWMMLVKNAQSIAMKEREMAMRSSETSGERAGEKAKNDQKTTSKDPTTEEALDDAKKDGSDVHNKSKKGTKAAQTKKEQRAKEEPQEEGANEGRDPNKAVEKGKRDRRLDEKEALVVKEEEEYEPKVEVDEADKKYEEANASNERPNGKPENVKEEEARMEGTEESGKGGKGGRAARAKSPKSRRSASREH